LLVIFKKKLRELFVSTSLRQAHFDKFTSTSSLRQAHFDKLSDLVDRSALHAKYSAENIKNTNSVIIVQQPHFDKLSDRCALRAKKIERSEAHFEKFTSTSSLRQAQ
jgi:hypothetical protein